MSDGAIVEAGVDLAWSLWTELGIPGVVRQHESVVLDPEPVLLFAPLIAARDARLLSLVYSWCAEHSGRISASRLAGLFRRAPMNVQRSFGEFSTILSRDAGIKGWPQSEASAIKGEFERRRVPLPMERPALVCFRMRAFSGVGARADVLGHLLANASSWSSAAAIAHLGYSKRNIAQMLTELSNGALVWQKPRGKTHEFKLRHPDALATLVNAGFSLTWPRWMDLLTAVSTLLELEGIPIDKPATRRVEAGRCREALDVAADHLSLERPPSTIGEAEAAAKILAWGQHFVRALADGQNFRGTRRKTCR